MQQNVAHYYGIAAFETDIAIPNEQLLGFGEAKHMSAFAKLVA
jgi:hypothetical protein